MRDFRKYTISKNFPKEEVYGLVSQIRRAASSIPTNISEGCGRDSDAEFNRFLTIAAGSANETEYLLILSKDLNYIDNTTYDTMTSRVNSIKKKMYSLKQKLNN